MTVSFTAANNAVSVQPEDIILSALQEIGVLSPGEDLPGEQVPWCLEKLQRLIDSFNAQREVIFNQSFALFTLQANHAPHTIGPSGDFNVPIRPVKLLSAAVVLNSGTNNPIDLPVRVRDDEWWAANPLKSLVSSITTDCYYDPASPLGNLNFWPISDTANKVRLEYWSSLTQAIDLTTPLALVQGYWDAIVLSLAVRLFPSFWNNREPGGALVAMQQSAMKIIMDNNGEPPRIDTNSGGIPQSGRGGRPDFNFLTGLRE